MSCVLIALHGGLARRSALKAVLNYCREMKFKVNVLLVDGGNELSPVLADFLDRLKQAGLNGRLYRQSGTLGQAVLNHVGLHRNIQMILVDSMKNLGSAFPFKGLPQPIGLISSVAAW